MQTTSVRFRKSLPALHRPAPVAALPPAPIDAVASSTLPQLIQGWLLDCELRYHSANTLTIRALVLRNLLWFLTQGKMSRCGTPELRGFLAYLRAGHAEPGGRWGNPQMTTPVRPRTVETYRGHLVTFFRWLVDEGVLEETPMRKIKPPECRPDQIKPFTAAQVSALLSAARESRSPRRDQAIVWLMYATGIRSDELCRLRRKDLDLTEHRITVQGKGNKERSIYFNRKASRALWFYLRDLKVEEEGALFPAERGKNKGRRLSGHSLRDIFDRLGQRAGIEGVRCSPHTLRHAHALEFLRKGGTLEQLRERLGHTSIKMTLRYVALSEADLVRQRRFDPADDLPDQIQAPRRPPRQAAARPLGADGRPLPMPQKIQGAKVTEEDVRAIRARLVAGARRADVGAEYGLSARAVKDIALGYTWRHVE